MLAGCRKTLSMCHGETEMMNLTLFAIVTVQASIALLMRVIA